LKPGGLALAAFALTLLGVSLALASPFHPELERARASLKAARGPEAYAALRELWTTWDRADPAHVESALAEAAADPRQPPPARAYAMLLRAYARLRLGDLVAARDTVAGLGYVHRWQLVGPFDDEGKVGLATEYAPELELTEAIVPGRAYTGKTQPVRYREVPPAFQYGYIDTGSLIRPEQRVCAYLRTFVRHADPGAGPRDISLWVGSGGAFKLFWNGERVLEDPAYRDYDAERFAVRVHLEKGVNDLTLKLCGQERAPVASVRIADARGAPDPKIVVSASLELGEQAAHTVRSRKPRPAGRPALEGPLQTFERLATGRGVTARTLEAYARYLVATRGDEPASHRARGLVEQAADAEPTVERFLLAADLAEDQNRRARWIERAEALTRDRPDVRVLVARAALLAEGLGPQQAFPLYEQVLALDPDHVAAIQGRVELYNRAGLRRSALSVLEAAVERTPESVLLLNMYASQLEALGRATEAAEVRARYSARRFQDPSFSTRMIQLSVARRNTEEASRWLDRFLAAESDSPWALGLGARTHRALGQADRSIALYEQALELAPDDVGTLRQLADLRGELGDRSEQLALLQRIRKITPQDKEIREYIEHLEPAGRRLDERYAWAPDRFLQLRHVPPKGENRRTLVDVTVSTVFENGLSSQFRQIVFQPLSDAAAAFARQYAFQYQADRQRVQLRGARVYRTDGSTDEATESGEGAADNPAIAMYTSARTFYVQFPRLEPGDVVELRYRVDDVGPTNEMADYFGEVTYLQASEPVLRAEYVLVTPRARKFHIDTARLPGLERRVSEDGDRRVYRFSAKDVPAVVPEPSMPPWPSVLGYVHVSTFGSWKEMGQWYWGLAKDQFDLDAQTRELAHRLGRGRTTDLEKVTAVFDWVVQNTRYVALEFGIYGYKPRRSVQTVARGWGDCKDKATVIVSLLRELGIDATIVIVRTGLRGDWDSRVASLAPFDHAIAYVPSLDLYLDGTAEYAGVRELPAMDVGALALRIHEGNSELVRLPLGDPEKNHRARTVSLTLDPTGAARDLRVEYETRGVHAPGFRRRFEAEGTRRERLIEDLAREFPGFELGAGPTAVQTSDLSDIEQDVTLTVRGASTRFARREGERLTAPVTPGLRLTPQYASLSTRKLPVALPPIGTLSDQFTVKIPRGMRLVGALPQSRVESPFGSLEVSSERSGTDLVVRTRLVIRAHQIEAAQYEAWKKFCGDVDAALDARLALEAA
jgi:cellulose synthase operon protein C